MEKNLKNKNLKVSFSLIPRYIYDKNKLKNMKILSKL
jgi:hypothetical protein